MATPEYPAEVLQKFQYPWYPGIEICFQLKAFQSIFVSLRHRMSGLVLSRYFIKSPLLKTDRMPFTFQEAINSLEGVFPLPYSQRLTEFSVFKSLPSLNCFDLVFCTFFGSSTTYLLNNFCCITFLVGSTVAAFGFPKDLVSFLGGIIIVNFLIVKKAVTIRYIHQLTYLFYITTQYIFHKNKFIFLSVSIVLVEGDLNRIVDNIISMGICQNKKSNEKVEQVSTKALLNHQIFGGINFYFSTQNLLRVQSKCLLIFCDKTIKVNKNVFLQRAGSFQSRKIDEYARACLLQSQKQLVEGESIIFAIEIPLLKFKKVALCCLPSWDGKEAVRGKMEQIIEKTVREIAIDSAIDSLVVTQMNEELGIPLNVGAEVLASAINHVGGQLKDITILCENSTNVLYFTTVFQNYNEEAKTKTNEGQNNSYEQSVYF